MPTTTTIAAGSSAAVSLAAGSVLRLNGLGSAQIAPPGAPGTDIAPRTLNAGETSFGPFTNAVTVNVSAASTGAGVQYFSTTQNDANAASGAQLLNSTQAAAVVDNPVTVPSSVTNWNPGLTLSTTYSIQAGAGGPNGKYYYRITGMTGTAAVGTAPETACPPANPANPIVTGGAVASITLLQVPTFTDSRVTRRNIYRSKDATTDPSDTIARTMYLVGTINDNTTTTFVDNVPDASLTTLGPYVDTTGVMWTYNGTFVANAGGVGTFLGMNGPTAQKLGYYNAGFGTNALASIAGGVRNVGIGGDALQFVTTGSGNTALGVHAGAGNQSGSSNISIGYSAAQIPGNNGTGSFNIAIGNSALAAEASGSQNVALGYQAGQTQNGASQNTYLGYKTGANTTTGQTNVGVGCNTMGTSGSPAHTGNNNVCIGYNVAAGATGAFAGNTVIGASAGAALTNGLTNTCIGASAGAALTSNSSNVAIGNCANKYGQVSNEFYLNNQDRTNNANEKTQSLMYGVFNAAAASQTLVINAATKIGVDVAVASLPAASAALKGYRMWVTDANATHTAGIGAIVAGGGANYVPVYCDGTNWRIG